MSLASATSTEGKGGLPARPAAGSYLPGMTEMQMSKLTYREQLLHPNWQRKRLEVLNRDNFRCCMCEDDQTTLHVHHKQYAKGRLAWEYPNDELVTLCEPCHGAMHEEVAILRDVTAKLPVEGDASMSGAAALLGGWASVHTQVDFDHTFGVSPGDFMVGQVAALLWGPADAGTLSALVEALKAAPPWVVRQQTAEFVRALREHVNDAAPPAPPHDPAWDL